MIQNFHTAATRLCRSSSCVAEHVGLRHAVSFSRGVAPCPTRLHSGMSSWRRTVSGARYMTMEKSSSTAKSSSDSGYVSSGLELYSSGLCWGRSSLRQKRSTSASSAAASPFPPNPHILAPAIVPVSAIHAAQTIDLNKLLPTIPELHATSKQMFGKNSIVIRLTDIVRNNRQASSTNIISSSSAVSLSTVDPSGDPPEVTDTVPRYVAVFRFGSIVFFNVTPAEASKITGAIKQFASEPFAKGAERKENFGVLITRGDDWGSSSLSSTRSASLSSTTSAVSPSTSANTAALLLDEASPVATLEPVTGDYCIVPELDMNGVAVIGTIMAQTVALDRYSDTVDDLLNNFARINTTVSKTGSFTSTDKNSLFKTVAQNNSIVIDMISKVRIKDRSDTAWNLTKYQSIHYGLKEEFELDDRFENIEFKLNLIQNNAKFFLDVLHHQKSSNLEWIIVVLILAECILMCVEMSGMSGPLFKALSGLSSFLSPASLLTRATKSRTNQHVEDNEGSIATSEVVAHG